MSQSVQQVGRWAKLFGCTEAQLRRIAWEISDAERYRFFMIPKSNGGMRLISEPKSLLKEKQDKIGTLLVGSYTPLSCSHGFTKNRGIITNADLHVRKPWVLNVDLEKFFPSISIDMVEKVLSKRRFKGKSSEGSQLSKPDDEFRLEPIIVSLLANLCCFRSAENSDDPETLHGLPQGAPTSPVISDLVARRMDLEIMRFCRKRKLVYSRYADDISFSPQNPRDYSGYKRLLSSDSEDGKIKLCDELLSIIVGNGFRIQHKKTTLFTKKSCKRVTGLNVNEFVNVPRETIRSIRGDLRLWEKFGYERANEILHGRKNYRHKKCPKSLRRMLSGKLCFLSMVRGKGDPIYIKFVKRMNHLLGDEGAADLRDFSKDNGLPICLDDFPKRTASHFSGRRRIFLEHRGDLRSMLRTEIGSWAFERLDFLFDIRTNLRDEYSYDPFTSGGKTLLEYMLEAEAAYLHLIHDEHVFSQAYEAFARLFYRVMKINGDLCGKLLTDPAFGSHLESIDWEMFFLRMNDEFFAQRYWRSRMTSEKLRDLAANEDLRSQPHFSLMLWTSLFPVSRLAEDEEVLSYGLKFQEVIEKSPSFFLAFDEVATCSHRVNDGNFPSMGMDLLREGIYFMIRAFGRKPALCKVT